MKKIKIEGSVLKKRVPVIAKDFNFEDHMAKLNGLFEQVCSGNTELGITQISCAISASKALAMHRLAEVKVQEAATKAKETRNSKYVVSSSSDDE